MSITILLRIVIPTRIECFLNNERNAYLGLPWTRGGGGLEEGDAIMAPARRNGGIESGGWGRVGAPSQCRPHRPRSRHTFRYLLLV
jgi:hypothetical protein